MDALSRALILLAVAASLGNSESNGASNYVGSKSCFGCHPNIYRSFQKTDMGGSMRRANDWIPGVLPSEAMVTVPDSSRSFRVYHDPGGWHQSESEPGVFTVEHQLEYTVGSGANGLSFIIRRGQYLFQAPLSYFAKTQKWDFSPGYEKADLGFGRSVTEECINCHAGRAAPIRDQPGAFNDPPFQELSIGCENCHGPGERHVKSAGKQAGSIVNPAKLAPRLAENVCMNCHQSGEVRVLQPGKNYADFRPGQWLFDTAVILKTPVRGNEAEGDLLQHFSAMQESRCFRASGGKLSCLSCHDPHVQPRNAETPAYFRAKCVACHNDKSCGLALKVRVDQNSNDCVACHMPKRNVLQISHSALTNHRIPARSKGPELAGPTKEIDGLVVVNPPGERPVQLSRLTLLRAYGSLSAQNPEFQRRYVDLLDQLSKDQPQDRLVQEALGHKALAEDQPEAAIEHLKLALPLGDSSIYLEIAEAFAKLGRYEEAIEYLKKGVPRDPYNAVMQKTLVLQYINTKNYVEARRSLEHYVETFPDDWFMRNMLQRVSK